jgi:pimeloyl-ACP methyl ester carboxylesterase
MFTRIRKKRICVVTLLLILASTFMYPSLALANGTISGNVKTSSGTAVPYTRVTWGAVTTGGCINNPGHAFTNAAGNWQSPILINGSYSVGSGSSPCVDKAYLCTAGNAPLINNNNVTGINFIKPLYSISTSVGLGGAMTVTYGDDADSPTIAATGSVPAVCNALMHFTITPDGCHTIANVVVDGSSVGAVSTYTFSGVQANHSISVSFAANVTYTIVASAGANGTISPSGSVTVGCGGSQAFTITPSGCYQVADVLVDGVSVGARPSYTFTNVQTNHTISASFSTAAGYSITSSAGSNGSISPSGSVSVPCGGSQSFTMTPSPCYHVQSVVVDGTSVGAPGSYTFSNVQASHTISVSFTLDTYTIAATAGIGGSIAPSGSVVVNCGASRSFTIAAGTCYVISNVLVDGTSRGPITSYTFNNVQSGHTISASFAANSGVLPTIPTGLSVMNLGTGTSLHASWNPVTGATSYVLRRVGGGGTTDTPVSGTQTDITNLTRTTSYAFSAQAINGCGAGQFSPTVSRAPDWYPVLLVHGICGSSADFTQCSLSSLGELACIVPNPGLLGDVLKSAGISHVFAVNYPNNASIASVAPTVAQRVRDILTATGESRLNIIAHSQGGLVSRYATQTLGMSSRVANLVMIGTPNHGSEWAKWMILAPAFQPSWMKQIRASLGLDCLATGQAGYDLVPGSAFLNQLNYGNNTGHYDALANPFNPFQICPSHYAENLPSSTQCWLILGTGGWCGLPGAAKGSVGLCEPNDGVVSIANGRLSGLEAFYSRADDGLDPAPARHPRATHFAGSTQFRGHGAGCNLEELKHPTLISAAYLIATTGTLPGSPSAQPGEVATELGDPSEPWIQTADVSSAVTVGEVLRDTVTVGSAKAITFLQAAEAGGLDLAVIDPSGVRWSLADTLSGALSYEGDPEAGLQALTFGTPAHGRWVIESSSPSKAQNYSAAAFIQADTLLTGELVGFRPDSLRARSACFGPSGPLPDARITALLELPDSSSIPVPLYDDGAHGDSLIGDGIFGAVVPTARGSGAYVLRLDGTIEQSDVVLVHQQSFATAVVQPLPDLQIDATGVVISRVADSEDSLTVVATVRNVGLAAAGGALIQFEEPAGVVATKVADIDSSGAITVSVGWRPSRSDSSSMLVYIDRASPFLQCRYDNDSVAVVLNPSSLAVEPAHTPIAVWLASPAPNPVVGHAIIRFGLPRAGRISLSVFDVAGRRVATLLDGTKNAGAYAVPWGDAEGGRRIGPGMYFVELRAEGHQIVRRAVFLR